jgi:replicative DNA helicase
MVSQLQILSKVLETKDYSLISLNNLEDKYFFNYKKEFNFIKNHYEKFRQVPDKLTFLNTFPDFDYVETTEPNNYLLEQLYKDYNRSYLAERFNTIKPLLEQDKTDSAIEYFLNSVEDLHVGNVMTYTNLLKDTSRYDHYLERTANHKNYYISTGFEELDKLIGGIDRENENFVIAARTGIGKTQTMIKMAAAASMQGLNVAIYEGEMTADKIGYRLDTFIGHIQNSAINRGDVFIKREYEQYIKSLTSANYGEINVLTPTDVPGPVTVDVLRSFVEKTHADILFIDQYSLMEDTSHAKTSFERVGNIARDIKKLQVEKKIPIIAVSQMNRTKNEDGKLDTTQIGLSDMIPQYATVLIMLDKKDDILTLNIVKARDGGNGALKYSCNFNTGTMVYIPEDKEGQKEITSEEDYENMAKAFEKTEENPF